MFTQTCTQPITSGQDTRVRRGWCKVGMILEDVECESVVTCQDRRDTWMKDGVCNKGIVNQRVIVV